MRLFLIAFFLTLAIGILVLIASLALRPRAPALVEGKKPATWSVEELERGEGEGRNRSRN
jgi:hypothetical protein